MTACPNCGFEQSDARRLVKSSARDLVESLQLDADLMAWCKKTAPDFDAVIEIEQFKDRMRTNGYKTNAGPVKDARAAFRTHMRNAVVYRKRNEPSKPVRTVPARKDV